MRHLTTRALPQEGCAAFPCPEADCPDRFATQARLLRHLRSVHQQKKPLVCPYEGCGKRFAANHRLLVHTPVHSREKPYSCPWEGCDKRFSQSSNRKAHYQLHSGERPFACPHEACHKRFVQRAHLTCHLRAHSGKKTFVCPEAGCHKRFTQATNMTNHLRRHTHPFRSFRFVCHHEGCGRRLPTRYCLEVHLRVHSREKPFVCAYQDCNSRFSQYNNLVSHHRLHSGEKPYACPYENCDKAFRQPHHLKKHLGTHTKKAATDGQQSPEKQGVWASRSGPVLAGPPAAADDRPEDPLRQATTDTLPPGAGPMLPEQAPVHSGERPFACPEASCLSRFATQGRMLRHLRAVHRHQKPFACPDENCDKHFMQQVHLQSHLRTHTKDPVTTDRLPDDDSRSQPLGRHARKGTARRTAVPCQQELQGTQPPSRSHVLPETEDSTLLAFLTSPAPRQSARPDSVSMADRPEQPLTELQAPLSPRLPPVPLSTDCLSWLAHQTARANLAPYPLAADPGSHATFRQWLTSPAPETAPAHPVTDSLQFPEGQGLAPAPDRQR